MSIVTDAFLAIRQLDGMVSKDLPKLFLESDIFDYICGASLLILFITLLIQFFSKIVSEGYSFSLAKKLLLQCLILVAIINPLTYKALIGIYIDISLIMLEALGESEFNALRTTVVDLYSRMYDNGPKGIALIFGLFNPLTTINVILPSAFFILFLLSIYQVLIFPVVLITFVVALIPLMLAFYPIDNGMIRKVADLLFGIGILFPAVLSGLSGLLVVPLALVTGYLESGSLKLLSCVCLAFSVVIAYSLPLIGYISNINFLKEFRMMFPVTWLEYVCTKGFSFLKGASKVGGKKRGRKK